MTNPDFPLCAVAGTAARPDRGEFSQLVVMNAFGHERWALCPCACGHQVAILEGIACLHRFNISGLGWSIPTIFASFIFGNQVKFRSKIPVFGLIRVELRGRGSTN